MNSLSSRLPAMARILAMRIRAVNSQQAQCSSYGENDEVVTTLVNRNPRNMEMLRLSRKPQGWHLEASSPRYWYKLVLDHSKRHITGRVEHHTGSTVVSASTRESALKNHLYSTSDVAAALNIGRVLAYRCLQSGIAEVYTELDQEEENSEKVRMFLGAVRDGGVEMKEPNHIQELDVSMFANRRTALPWHVTEEDALNDITTTENKENKPQ